MNDTTHSGSTTGNGGTNHTTGQGSAVLPTRPWVPSARRK